jgi:hypothetical protein
MMHRLTGIRRRAAFVVASAAIGTGIGFTAVSLNAGQKAGAPPMVVYKSPT